MHDKKAAIYIRVSTDAQREEGYSIDAQQGFLTNYCKLKDIEHYDYYIDGGFTGSNLERPEMQRLISDAKAERLSHVLVYKLDRLSRSQKDTLFLIEDIFNLHGITFVSLNENIDTGTSYGRAMIGILSAFAQLERENIRERTRMGMLERVKDGYWMGGGRVPFGYDYDSEKNILVPNKDAETVRKIYDLYLQGNSPQSIANMLGLKYDRLAVQILKRKSNTGVIVYNGEEYQGKHEPIISTEIYNQAMQMMIERSTNKSSSSNSLLAGLLYCGKCGAKMHYQSWGKSGKKIKCYSQQTHKPYLVKDPNCDQESFWTDEIEDVVIEDIFSFSLEHSKIEGGLKESVLDAMINKQALLSKKIKKLYNLLAESDDNLLLETIADNKRELRKISLQIQMERNTQLKTMERENVKDTIANISDLWGMMTPKEQKNIVNLLIDKIIVKDRAIEINYKL